MSNKCLEKLFKGTFCFKCIAKDIEEERGERAKVAIGRNKDIEANVDFLEEKVDKIIQEDTKTKQTSFFGFCPGCIWRYKRGKKSEKDTVEIKRPIDKGKKFENIKPPRRLPDVKPNSNYISFKSRESEYKELLNALKDDNNYIIGVQGMGGIGKTRLVKEAGNELKESGRFAHVIYVIVSFTSDIKKIQDDIAGPLGLQWEDCSESDRPKRLRSRLTNGGEKILLILDDVQDQEPLLDFHAIGIPNRDYHKVCRVLVTTRSKQMFNKVNMDKTIELKLLSEEDAWFMFQSYADIMNSSSNNVIVKGRKIAKECKGLPVAIAVIAHSLKGQQHDVDEWDVTLKSWKKLLSMQSDDDDDDMAGFHKCLMKFSYDNMKDEKVKILLLLCSIFPEEEEISTEVLTRLCIGAGLFGEGCDIYNDARKQVAVARKKLLDSCLLLEVGKKHVKMHDLIRDLDQLEENKEIRGVDLSNKNQNLLVEWEATIRYLLCKGKCKDLFSYKFDGPKLETLIVDMERDEDCICVEVLPNSFFENIVKLRVLYFSGNGGKPLSLPHSIQSLTNIRSILVDRVDLGNICILENLQSLETLDLVQCTINELPSEITKLEKFKLLNLENCEIKMNNPFEVIEKCSSLEELYFIDSFNGFCREITLPELKRYHISKGLDVMNDSPSKYQQRVFHANDDADCFSKATLNYIMQTAEVLRLNEIKGEWRNLMPEIVPIDQDMHDLVELHLSCISQLQCLIDIDGSQAPTVLSKLVVLKLNRMENLEELFKGTLSSDSLKNFEKLSIKDCKHLQSFFKCKLSLCNLKTIKLQGCPMLVSLNQLLTSGNLVVLETLKIAHCVRLKNIIADERREENGGNNNKCLDSMFPELKVLDIEGCPLLEYIFPFLFVHDLPVLETIKIRRCDELKYIFGQYQDEEFSSLRQLELCQLPNFIEMFRKSNHPISMSEKGPSSTSNEQLQLEPMKRNIFSWDTKTPTAPLIDVDYSKSNLYFLYLWKEVECLQIQSKIICNLTKIELSYLSKIKSVFILSIAPRMSLKSLTIRNCDELKCVVIDYGDYDSGNNNWGNVFPDLNEIYVEDCAQLKYLIGHYTDVHKKHVEIQLHLPELKYLSLSKLPHIFKLCPKEYRTTFPGLIKNEYNDSSQAAINSITDSTIDPVSESLDSTIMKDHNRDEQITMIEPLATQYVEVENQHETSMKETDYESIEEASNDQVFKGVALIETTEDFGAEIEVQELTRRKFTTSRILLRKKLTSSQDHNMDAQIALPSQAAMIEPFANDYFDDESRDATSFRDDDFGAQIELGELAVTIKRPETSFRNDDVDAQLELWEIKPNDDGFESFQTKCLKETDYENIEEASNHQGETTEVHRAKIEVQQQCNYCSVIVAGFLLLLLLFGAFSHHITFFESPKDIITHLRWLDISMVITFGDHGEQELPNINIRFDVNMNASSMGVRAECENFGRMQDIVDDALEKDGDGQITIPSLTPQNIDVENWNETISLNDDAVMKVNSTIEEQFPNDDEMIVSKSRLSSIEGSQETTQTTDQDFDLYLYMESVYRQLQEETKGHHNGNENPSAHNNKEFAAWMVAEIALRHKLVFSQIKAKHEYVEKISDIEIPPTLSTTSKTKNEQKGIEIHVEEGTTSTNAKTITSSGPLVTSECKTASQEDGDGNISIPSFSTVNTNLPSTKYVDIGDSQETIGIKLNPSENKLTLVAMEGINNLIEEDPLLAFERLLTGQVSISSLRFLLQELKTLMDSSSDLDLLVSNKESKSKLISLFHQLNQHQGMLTSDLKDFVEKVQNFFNENIIKEATSQQIHNKHNQLLDSKSDLMNQLWSAKNTQAHIDNDTSTANAQIHELSLQIDDLKLVMKKCDVQKMKLKAECTELAQQSKELISALASSKVAVTEVERARNLAKEDFANLKSSFPTF